MAHLIGNNINQRQNDANKKCKQRVDFDSMKCYYCNTGDKAL